MSFSEDAYDFFSEENASRLGIEITTQSAQEIINSQLLLGEPR